MEVLKMKSKKLDLLGINVVASGIIAFAVSTTTYCNKDSKLPETLVIKIAVDETKIPTKKLDIPVYLSAKYNYKSPAHYEMLDLFKRGDPFVAVRFENLELHVSQAGNYYGLAQSFYVEKYPLNYLEEESL